MRDNGGGDRGLKRGLRWMQQSNYVGVDDFVFDFSTEVQYARIQCLFFFSPIILTLHLVGRPYSRRL